MKFAPHVWTLDEIRRCRSRGWFYGFFRDESGALQYGEIHPAWGSYCSTLPEPRWSPRAWWYAIRDLRFRP